MICWLDGGAQVVVCAAATDARSSARRSALDMMTPKN
jgi:hypothetical protein